MSAFWLHIWRILRNADTELVGLFIGVLYTATWGVGLLAAPRIFDNPVYATMADLAPQQVWGWLFVGIGLASLIGLGTKTLWLRLFTSLACTILWGLVAYVVGHASAWQATGPYHFGLVSTASLWTHLRIWEQVWQRKTLPTGD